MLAVDVVGSHPGLPDVLGEQVHAGLVGVLDDSVVVRADVDRHRRQLSRRATGETGERDGLHAVLVAHSRARTMFGERPDDETAISTSPGRASDCSWYSKTAS